MTVVPQTICKCRVAQAHSQTGRSVRKNPKQQLVEAHIKAFSTGIVTARKLWLLGMWDGFRMGDQ